MLNVNIEYMIISGIYNNTNYNANCVTALAWTLTETGKYCPDTISKDTRDSLGDCKTHCETNGANRLTFFPNNYCRCCTASSALLVDDYNNGNIYSLKGNYMYLATLNRNRYS